MQEAEGIEWTSESSNWTRTWRRSGKTTCCPFMDEHLSDEILEQERRLGNGFVPEYRRAPRRRGGWTSGATEPDAEPSALDPVQAAFVRAEEARRGRSLFPVLGSNELVTSVIAQFGSPELAHSVGTGSPAWRDPLLPRLYRTGLRIRRRGRSELVRYETATSG